MNTTQILAGFFLGALTAHAQLVVTVSPPKITGQKAVVPLVLENHFTNRVESARAVCFLLDGQGKIVGQSTKWIIGQSKTGMEPGATNTFNFIITSPQPFTTTNLTARISFSQIALDGSKPADILKNVTILEQ